MDVNFNCPKCNTEYHLNPEQQLGRIFRCNVCDKHLQLINNNNVISLIVIDHKTPAVLKDPVKK